MHDRGRLAAGAEAIAGLGSGEPQIDEAAGRVSVAVGGEGSQLLVSAVRLLDAAGVDAQDMSLRRPSLDDVFLSLTGHAAEDEPAPDNAKHGRGAARDAGGGPGAKRAGKRRKHGRSKRKDDDSRPAEHREDRAETKELT